MMVGIFQTKLSHNRVGKLAVRLRSSALDATELEEALAWSVDDPTLRVAYWASQLGHYVDGRGSRLDDLATGTRSTRVIEHDGHKVATLVYDPTLDQAPGLIDAVAATAGLALDNEGLRAELRGQLVDLQESRARLVTVEQAERQRLERNLHDGAQQRLLGIGLSLQLVRSQLDKKSPDVEEVLDEAQVELREAIRELRHLARGLHPAVLTESGLRIALDALGTRAPFEVNIDYEAPESLGTQIDAAAYYVVAESITNATKHANASRCRVIVKDFDGAASITVIDDGVGGADPTGSGLTGLSDRVTAVGGVLRVHSPPDLGTSIVAEFPCES
jgi:signal transduction histidine kinase